MSPVFFSQYPPSLQVLAVLSWEYLLFRRVRQTVSYQVFSVGAGTITYLGWEISFILLANFDQQRLLETVMATRKARALEKKPEVAFRLSQGKSHDHLLMSTKGRGVGIGSTHDVYLIFLESISTYHPPETGHLYYS